MAPARDSAFLPEVWALYSLGAAWLVVRILVHICMRGLTGIDGADALALMALAAWTYTAAVVEITYYDGTNTDYTVDESAGFDQQMRDQLEYGSKLFFGSWYAYIVLVFSLKGIVTMLYRNFLVEYWQRIVLHVTTFICVAGFTGITLAISLICLPLRKRWQLLSIPVPLLWTLRIPLMKRIGVFILLSSGIFVFGACIIRVSLTAVSGTSVLVIARWGIREIFVAIIAVNPAAVRPIFRPSFRVVSSPHTRHRSCTPQAHHGPQYIFTQPFPRLAVRLGRRVTGGSVLGSTSAGMSTIHAWNEAEVGSPEHVLEDRDDGVVSTMMSGGNRRSKEEKRHDGEMRKGHLDSAIESVSEESDRIR